MPEGTKVAIGLVVAVVVIGAAFFLLQGDDGTEPETGDASAATHDCQAGAFAQQQGNWGGVSCQEASGAATFTDTFTCEVPEESAVGGSLQEATSGSLRLAAEDAAGDLVFEETYTAGTHPVGDFIGEGEAGEWTVTIELSEDWQSGQLGIGVGCTTEEQQGGGTSPSGCQTTSDRRMQGTSMGQINCQDHQGEQSLEATFQCGVPEQGAANWDADVQAGQARVTIEDAEGQAIVDETFEGEESNYVQLQGGTAGEWTITAQLSSDFEGSFTVQGQCQTE